MMTFHGYDVTSPWHSSEIFLNVLVRIFLSFPLPISCIAQSFQLPLFSLAVSLWSSLHGGIVQKDPFLLLIFFTQIYRFFLYIREFRPNIKRPWFASALHCRYILTLIKSNIAFPEQSVIGSIQFSIVFKSSNLHLNNSQSQCLFCKQCRRYFLLFVWGVLLFF